MAVSEPGKDEHYDVFIVHSSDDNEKAEIINKGLQQKDFKTFAHYEGGAEFPAGRPVFDNIIHAVEQSDMVLILLTKSALKSEWVTFEVLMALEKSHRTDTMCVRLVFEGVSEEERKEFKKGTMGMIPDVVLDFKNHSWEDDLAAKLREKVSMRELLPAGNVAHGLVFNYYIGYLAYVLPETAKTVETCEYNTQGKFSKKFFIVIPESCKINALEGRHGAILIEKMPKPLEINAEHGDKIRKYNPTVYRISTDFSSESYFFTGDTPFILATMSKMNELGFVDIDLNLQVVRFRMTLMELVQHRDNTRCRDTATFISYHEPDDSPAPAIWDAVVNEFTTEAIVDQKISVKRGRKADGVFATIVHMTDQMEDHKVAAQLEYFLTIKGVEFTNGDSKPHFQALHEARWNIFILSEEAVKDPVISTQFQAALEASISDNQVQVIPVLASGSDIKNIPFNFKWTTILKKDEPEYIEKLWKTMQGDRKMVECLPSGVLYEGLAYSYIINYMPYNLIHKTADGRDFKERFVDAMVKYNSGCRCVVKVFVIVPKSCSFPAAGSKFTNEKHLGPLEPVVLGFRKYFLQLYRLTMTTGQKVCYAREYATPAIALHDMCNELPFAGLHKDEMNEQAKQFSEFCERIMQDPLFNAKIGDVRDKCEMVYFDDEKMGKEGVTTVLEERLKRCLKEGNFI